MFTPIDFFAKLRWIDGTALPLMFEPYRVRIFQDFFSRDEAGALRYNLGLFGRAKKNWKTADLVFACLYALMADAPGGNQVLLVANDEAQAGDDLALAKKVIKANPILQDWVTVRKNLIERKDGEGFFEIMPGKDTIGPHGRTFRFLGVDEIHGYRNWDLLEALAPDPTRDDCQCWITSYASIFHRPGVPLFDLFRIGKAGTDARMLFSWYAADFTTDPDFAAVTPEQRANPSMRRWTTPGYLAQQQRRLPAHKYRRLHLNLPGLPEGSAFQPEPVMDAIDRGVLVREPQPEIQYHAFVDMSGGSSDDACLAIAHRDADGVAVLDLVMNQGPRPPFDPRLAVERFVRALESYRIRAVTGDKYAGETFVADFNRHQIGYDVAKATKSELYESLEPALNGHRVRLLDQPILEQQLLGLVWRGGKIDHQNGTGEHDDHANAVAGAIVLAHEDGHQFTSDEVAKIFSIGKSRVGTNSETVLTRLHGVKL